MHQPCVSCADFSIDHAHGQIHVSEPALVLANDALYLAEAGAAADAARDEGRRPIEGDCPICFEDLQVQFTDRLCLRSL